MEDLRYYQLCNSLLNFKNFHKDNHIALTKVPSSKVAAIVFLVVLAGILLWQSSAIVALFENFSGDTVSEYTTISLVSGQYITYENENSKYVFSYRLSPADQTNLFYVAKDLQQTRSYPATPGAVYNDLGLEIKVSSVTAELAILLVKPISE